MDFAEVVRGRRMTRRFDPERKISPHALEMLLKGAFRAPSAGHTQGWRFLVLDDITSRSAFWSAASTGPADAWRDGLATAPVLVVCFGDPLAYAERYSRPDKIGRAVDADADRDPSSWPVSWWDVDTAMAALLILLGAQDQGLGACLFGVPGSRWKHLADAFAVPDWLRPVCAIALGHPADPPPPRRPARRIKPIDEVVSWGTFAASD